jgi:predicted metal-dependent phosphotriesterase family hydrolase
MHEHIFTLTADVQQNYPQEWGSEEARIADAAGKLRALAAQGITTIVDPTVVGLGRYIPRIQRVAEQVPELNIVVATGLTPTTASRSSSGIAARPSTRRSGPRCRTRWWTCSSPTSWRGSRAPA